VSYPTNQIGYTIVPKTASNMVIKGGEFRFNVNLTSGYTNSNIVVKANNNIIDKQGEDYVISQIKCWKQ
jgi:hypothetical protein